MRYVNKAQKEMKLVMERLGKNSPGRERKRPWQKHCRWNETVFEDKQEVGREGQGGGGRGGW